MEFLQLVSAIAANLNASNIENFISLVEGLVSLGENVLEHTENSANTSAPIQSATK